MAMRKAGGGKDRKRKGEEDAQKQNCRRIMKQRDIVIDRQRQRDTGADRDRKIQNDRQTDKVAIIQKDR
jgi:hypothetical protein